MFGAKWVAAAARHRIVSPMRGLFPRDCLQVARVEGRVLPLSFRPFFSLFFSRFSFEKLAWIWDETGPLTGCLYLRGAIYNIPLTAYII